MCCFCIQVSNVLLHREDDGDGRDDNAGIGTQMPPLRGLMLLSAKWGLLDLGDQVRGRSIDPVPGPVSCGRSLVL